MRHLIGLALALPLCVQPALAEVSLDSVEYRCVRDVTVLATYLNTPEESFAVIFVEGRQVALRNVLSASGAKYAQAKDDAGYVWWTKGQNGFLLWVDPATGAEDMLLNECKAR